MTRVFNGASFPGVFIDEFHDLLETVLGGPLGDDTSAEKEKAAPRIAPLAIDVEHFENEVVARADVPGATADEVEIETVDDLVTVSVKPKEAAEDFVKPEHSRYERPKRIARTRTFRVRRDFDPAAVTAALTDGVLTVTVPLKELAKPVSVKVSTAPSA